MRTPGLGATLTSTIFLMALASTVNVAQPTPASPLTPATAQSGRAGRPNIIFIMSDDHAAHAIGA